MTKLDELLQKESELQSKEAELLNYDADELEKLEKEVKAYRRKQHQELVSDLVARGSIFAHQAADCMKLLELFGEMGNGQELLYELGGQEHSGNAYAMLKHYLGDLPENVASKAQAWTEKSAQREVLARAKQLTRSTKMNEAEAINSVLSQDDELKKSYLAGTQ